MSFLCSDKSHFHTQVSFVLCTDTRCISISSRQSCSVYMYAPSHVKTPVNALHLRVGLKAARATVCLLEDCGIYRQVTLMSLQISARNQPVLSIFNCTW